MLLSLFSFFFCFYTFSILELQILREDLQQMKQYLTNCHIAQSKKLLWLLNKRHHFVENSQIYSLQDLQDLEAGTLFKYLQQVVKVYEAHITKECEVSGCSYVIAAIFIFLECSYNEVCEGWLSRFGTRQVRPGIEVKPSSELIRRTLLRIFEVLPLFRTWSKSNGVFVASQSCMGKGFHCELCTSKEIIFPLKREMTARCPQCLSVYHRVCYRNHKGFCPRCHRMSRRASPCWKHHNSDNFRKSLQERLFTARQSTVAITTITTTIKILASSFVFRREKF